MTEYLELPVGFLRAADRVARVMQDVPPWDFMSVSWHLL